MLYVLAKKPFSVWSLIGSLYTTQFLGMCFFSVALVAILREQGASLERISSVYVLGMVGAFKFLWAPLVDKIRFTPQIGHFRGWLLLMQSVLVIVLIIISGLDVTTDFGSIYLLCIVMAVCGATQDIATDGLVCSLLSEDERGIGNSIQTAGGMFGFMIGAGLVLMAFPRLGWQQAVLLLAAGTAVSLVQLLFFIEPEFKIQNRKGWQAVTRLVSFWKQPGTFCWLGMLLFFPMGITVAYSLLTPVLVDSQWSLERIGLIVNIFGPIMGIVSSLFAGWMISRFGRSKTMNYCIIMQVVSVVAILFIVQGHVSIMAVSTAVVIHFLGNVPSITMLSTLMMDRASRESPATDYTVQFSVYQFFAMGSGGIGMSMAGRIGYASTICVAIGLAIFAGIVARLYVTKGLSYR
ncbi:MFS transporter [uncultured Desulfovibrio sp.]|uniref:MFS transporter n=1 Tax=uncultured Desulfovibrio sp. TaxID=167968 RepID=UPI0003A03820|nr:MFS transporter [uncultured Desulfovibrio sp.]